MPSSAFVGLPLSARQPQDAQQGHEKLNFRAGLGRIHNRRARRRRGRRIGPWRRLRNEKDGHKGRRPSTPGRIRQIRRGRRSAGGRRSKLGKPVVALGIGRVIVNFERRVERELCRLVRRNGPLKVVRNQIPAFRSRGHHSVRDQGFAFCKFQLAACPKNSVAHAIRNVGGPVMIQLDHARVLEVKSRVLGGHHCVPRDRRLEFRDAAYAARDDRIGIYRPSRLPLIGHSRATFTGTG